MPALLLWLLAALLPFGGLYVNSLPTGADVWIDGRYIGRTPLLVDGLRDGKHSVTVTKAGWRVEEVDQNVTAGIITPATIQLEAIKPVDETGILVLHGVDRDARVSIDGGNPVALSPGFRLSVGTHRILVKETQATFQRVVVVYPDQTTHVLLSAPEDSHSAVVAPVTDYMPGSAAKITGDRVVIRWAGHIAIGHLGDAKFIVDGRDVVYDAPAGMVRGHLYAPLDLILTLTGGKTK